MEYSSRQRYTKDNGTVSHEIAHTLGQGREFYKPKEKCQTFRGDPLVFCKDYEIPRSLYARTENRQSIWEFIENKYSIVNNVNDITQLWIDRETYQKTFSVLAKRGAIIPEKTDLYSGSTTNSHYPKNQTPSFKVLISGFYYEKADSFIIPKTSVHKTDIQTPPFPTVEGKNPPMVTFQLRDKNNKILQEVKRPLLKVSLEALYKNKTSRKIPFEFCHLLAVLKLPENSQNKGLHVVVISPKGRVMYSVPVSIKKKRETVVFVDKMR